MTDIQIFVRGLVNTISVGPSDGLNTETRVSDFRIMVSNKVGIAPDVLMIIFATKQLNSDADGKTISEIGMQTNSTVTIVMRLLGGQNIEFKVKLNNDEEIKMEAESSCTIATLKKMIC
jgi:hypothetical protein